MTAKAWLNRAWRVQQEIEMLNRTKESIFERLTSTTASYSHTPGSATPDPHKMDAYADYCRQVDERARELTKIAGEVVAMISRVEDGRYRQLLLLRYVEYMTWEQIAVQLNYSWRWTMQLHAEALQAVDDLLNGTKKRQHRNSYYNRGKV